MCSENAYNNLLSHCESVVTYLTSASSRCWPYHQAHQSWV